jgi:hypothetical protein
MESSRNWGDLPEAEQDNILKTVVKLIEEHGLAGRVKAEIFD